MTAADVPASGRRPQLQLDRESRQCNSQEEKQSSLQELSSPNLLEVSVLKTHSGLCLLNVERSTRNSCRIYLINILLYNDFWPVFKDSFKYTGGTFPF